MIDIRNGHSPRIMSNENNSRVAYSIYRNCIEFNISPGLCIHQTQKRGTSVTKMPEAEGGQPVQFIGHTSKKVEHSSLVPNHSASDLQAGSVHLETSERRATVKWAGMSESTAWKEVNEDLSKTLESHMKGSITSKLVVIAEIVYGYGCKKLGVIEIKSKEGNQTKGGREREIEILKHRLKLVRKEWGKDQDQLKNIGLQILKMSCGSTCLFLRKADRMRRQRRTNLGNVLLFTVTLTNSLRSC